VGRYRDISGREDPSPDAMTAQHARRVIRACVVTLLLGASAIRAAGTPTLPTGRVGPYSGITSAAEARSMLADGLTLAIITAPARDVVTALREGGAKYIDTRLWNLVFAVCQRQFGAQTAARQPLACNIPATDEEQIAAQAAAYLRTVEQEPTLAGLWILDDYPHGDITSVLHRLHALVQESNVRSGFERPTVCGVGGSLDYKRNPDDAAFIQDHGYMDQALRNVFPSDCDLVSPYFYASAGADDPRLIDWSMKDLLPYFHQALRAKRYDTSAHVLLPIAHAFSAHVTGSTSYYVTPRPDDIATQMDAYCAAGASSIMFFTWRAADTDRSYSTDASLRAGVQRGRLSCTQLWHDRSKLPHDEIQIERHRSAPTRPSARWRLRTLHPSG
jgi:hypothetical protein